MSKSIKTKELIDFKKVFLAVVVLIVWPTFHLFAQPAPPSIPVPLDGGLVLLLAAGALYGSYRKKSQD
jgi:predicted neutral ceramidase superfamily lipid hydrolase